MLANLKALLQEYGISQQRLADAIQVSQPSINKYENHNIEPDIFILSKLADFFNTSIDYIVGRTDVRRPIEHVEAFHLNDEEMNLVLCFRALNPHERQCVSTVVETLQKK